MKKTLVFATHNPHKAKEIQQIVGENYEIRTLTDIGCHDEIPETAPDLEGNARLKARFVKENYGFDCFSEDTGLEVAALGAAPGVHTARYAGEAKNPQANMDLLLKNLSEKRDRRAQFRTVICLIFNGKEQLFEGICSGKIAAERHGTGGFGYDPIFIPKGRRKTFAQLGDEVKNRISHRAIATEKLLSFLQS
jgi:XTP/dITP diphosphohydrolase